MPSPMKTVAIQWLNESLRLAVFVFSLSFVEVVLRRVGVVYIDTDGIILPETVDM